MKRMKLTVAYDGTNYCGWQLQPNGITIEEVLNKALSDLLKEEIRVTGASRTDSGVHALGNVAVFTTESRIPADKMAFALNQKLPEDIRIQGSEEVEPDFHPRHCNSIKTYEYRILNRTFALPTSRFYSYFVYTPLRLELMQEAAGYLLGEHDFQSFCSSGSQAEDTYRIIYRLDVEKAGDMITLRITGNGFLYNMVRIIAGTLIKVGQGAYPPSRVADMLEAKERNWAGPKAPAQGLTLVGIEYEKELPEKLYVENTECVYTLWQKDIQENRTAYLEVERCREEVFPALIERNTKRAFRNGAKKVFLCRKAWDAPEKLEAGKYIYKPSKVPGYQMVCEVTGNKTAMP